MTKTEAGQDTPTLQERLLAYFGFGAVFIVVYGGADLISARLATRYDVSVWLDDAIPFLPNFALAYLLISLILLLPAVFLNDRARLFGFYAALSAQVVIAGVFFVLFPVAPIDAPDGGNLSMELADRMNLTWNYFPSLHVALALSCALVLDRNFGGPGRIVLWLVTALIVASTLFTKQHFIADVAAGGLLAAFGRAVIYPALTRRFSRHSAIAG